MNRPQSQPAKLGPLLAVLGLLLALWFGLAPKASAASLPLDHSDLFAANASPSGHQESDALPPKNRVWENFGSSNEITPADELNSLQLRRETHLSDQNLTSGIPVLLNADPIGFSGGSNWFAYADGNPISLSDPFGLCACSGGRGFGSALLNSPLGWMSGASLVDSFVSNLRGNGGDSYLAAHQTINPVYSIATRTLEASNGISLQNSNLGQSLPVEERIFSGSVATLEAVALGLGIRGSFAGSGAAKGVAPAVSEGTSVFRVWGDEAGAWGRSWTTVDPRTVPNFRNAAGLPTQNSGRFVTEGTLQNTRGVTTQAATPLHGNAGGLPEVVIPNSASQVWPLNVQGLNPPF
jgi:hypothetical protein